MKEPQIQHLEYSNSPSASEHENAPNVDLEKRSGPAASNANFAGQDGDAVVTMKTWTVVIVGLRKHVAHLALS